MKESQAELDVKYLPYREVQRVRREATVKALVTHRVHRPTGEINPQQERRCRILESLLPPPGVKPVTIRPGVGGHFICIDEVYAWRFWAVEGDLAVLRQTEHGTSDATIPLADWKVLLAKAGWDGK